MQTKGLETVNQRFYMNLTQARLINNIYGGRLGKVTNFAADIFGEIFTPGRVGMTRTRARNVLSGDSSQVFKECKVTGKFKVYGNIPSFPLQIPSIISPLSGISLKDVTILDDQLIILSNPNKLNYRGLLKKISDELLLACQNPENVIGTWSPDIWVYQSNVSLKDGLKSLEEHISKHIISFTESRSATYDMDIMVSNHDITFYIKINAMCGPAWGIPCFSFVVKNDIPME